MENKHKQGSAPNNANTSFAQDGFTSQILQKGLTSANLSLGAE